VLFCNEALFGDLMSVRSLSAETRDGYLVAMGCWDRLMARPLFSAGSGEVKQWFQRASGAGLSAGTILIYATRLRMLSRHGFLLRGLKKRGAKDESDELWDGVPFSDLKREADDSSGDRDMVVTEEELKAILSGCNHPRVRAYLAVLYESGCRKGEVRSLKIRHVVFGEKYTLIKVEGKTGERTVPLVFSVPYLRAWIQVHPDRSPDQWLFAVPEKGGLTQLADSSMNSALRHVCRRYGLRHVRPHMLRHTKLTEIAEAGVGEYQMDSFAGWMMGSRMPKRYIHLSGRSHLNAVLEAQGIEVPKTSRPRPKLSSDRCPKCDAPIGLEMAFCPACGYVLDVNLRPEELRGVDEKMLAGLEEWKKKIEEELREQVRLLGKVG
jgi:integrase